MTPYGLSKPQKDQSQLRRPRNGGSLALLKLNIDPALISGRSFSVSGFEFQHDLLPLSTSLADPDGVSTNEGGDKTLGLMNGTRRAFLSISPLLSEP